MSRTNFSPSDRVLCFTMLLLAAILGCAVFAWAMVLAVRGSVLTGCLLGLVAFACCGPYLL